MDLGTVLALVVVLLYWGAVIVGLWTLDAKTRRHLAPIAVISMVAALVLGLLVYAISKGDLR